MRDQVDSLNNLITYFYTLEKVNEIYNEMKSFDVNVFHDYEITDMLEYNYLELMLKLHEMVPFSISWKNTQYVNGKAYPTITEMKDNLFQSDIDFDFLKNDLTILANKNKVFFTFNATSRNVLLHHRHSLKVIGNGSNNNKISQFNIQLTIREGVSFVYPHIKKTYVDNIDEEFSVKVFDDSFKIIKAHETEYHIGMYSFMDTVERILNQLNNIFAQALETLHNNFKSIVCTSSEEYLKTGSLRVISYWKKRLRKVYK